MSASKSALESYFETGDVPTQSQYAELINAYPNLNDENMLIDSALAVTAVVPPVQATATELTKLTNVITVSAGGSGGVKLPSALAGRWCVVTNSAGYALSVFPQSGEQIKGLAPDSPQVLSVGDSYFFVSSATGKYVFVKLAAVVPYTPPVYASLQSSPANPTGTASLTPVMMGLAQSFTPTASGKVMIVISGTMFNSNDDRGGKAFLQYGTGTAPANGAAVTGTQAGNFAYYEEIVFNQTNIPFAMNAILFGGSKLNVGTTYWFDIALNTITGDTVSATNLSLSIVELPT